MEHTLEVLRQARRVIDAAITKIETYEEGAQTHADLANALHEVQSSANELHALTHAWPSL